MRKELDFLREQLGYLENENAEQMKMINSFSLREEELKGRNEQLEDMLASLRHQSRHREE